VALSVKVRIKLLRTNRANTVTELGFGMIANVFFDLIPVTVVIAYVLAGGAYWQ
jgi:hypothetical protein